LTEVWNEQFSERAINDDTLGLDDPEVLSNEVITLLDGGRLYKELNIGGQQVRLRTLLTGEELECGLLVSKYNGSPEEGRAYIAAVVGAAIETIDGRPIASGLGPISDDERVRRQFDYVRKNMYWSHIQTLYERGYIPLLDELRQALEELQSK
jgi:hypothetical protein